MKLLRISSNHIAPLACLLIAGCNVTTKPKHFVNTFVPPAPKLPAPYAIQPPELSRPPAGPSFLQSESPKLLAQYIADAERAPTLNYLTQQAEAHYTKGSLLMGKGEAAGARTEFDKAVQTLIAAPASLPGREKLVARAQRMMEDIYRMEVELAAANAPTQEPVFDKAPLEEAVDLTFPVEPSLKGKVRAQLGATVSQLPLEMADPVISFVNFFQSPRGRDILVSGFYRSGRYAPMIKRILDEEGLPQELIYLAQAESGFLPRAVSYMAAGGMWQFITSRGKEYGLNQSSYTDDRFDPEKATRAAARHLRDLYAEFGDWYLAIAAYNCGPLAVDRAIQRTGYADFWELYKRNVLPKETANYVPIILAMTLMAKNPKDYNLESVVVDKPWEYDTIKVNGNTHLALVADLVGRPLSEIRDLNPGVLRMIAPDGYQVHVPRGSAKQVLAALETVPSVRRASWRIHKVTPKETVAIIAKQYKVTEKSISDANAGVDVSAEPREGEFLVIPVGYPGAEGVFTNASYSKWKPARQTWRAPARTAPKPTAKWTPRPAAKAPAKPAAKAPAKPVAKSATGAGAPKAKPAATPTRKPVNRASAKPSTGGRVASNVGVAVSAGFRQVNW